MKRTIKALLIIAIIIIAALMTGWRYYAGDFGQRLSLTKKRFDHLHDWQQDNHLLSLQAFLQSCTDIQARKPEQAFSKHFPQAGLVRDWQQICQAAHALPHPDPLTARAFFEKWFTPYQVTNHLNPHGKFTGYYLPQLNVSLKRDKHYSVPIYALPKDLIQVNLGAFSEKLSGKRIVGRIKNNILVLYPNRADINRGDIHRQAKVLAWTDSAIDLFFAQIQGSAMAKLPNHQQFLLGYSGANGRDYTAIGSILLAQQALTKENMSMQSIREWLLQHPDQADAILNRNASYVFFRKLAQSAPIGVEQVPLTPERSLAVDTSYIPLGVPIWLETSIPHPTDTATTYRRLLIAQDTGSAIKGPIRGDIYFGPGDKAAFFAGHMNQSGKYWLLLPRSIQH